MSSQGSLGHLGGFKYNDEWIGTELPLMSIESASNFEYSSYDMARWPDQILRRPAGMISKRWIGSNEVKNIAYKLRNTANMYGAVGLAAQQCGIDASIIFLDTNTSQSIVKKNNIRNIFSFYNKASGSELNDSTEQGIFLINPRIVARSPEVDMKVWIEKCLVLPPEFTATVLRDSIVTVRYQNLEGDTVTSTFQGELARAVQHEMDHDRGILILDHIGLEEVSSFFQILKIRQPNMFSSRRLT
jgi:peptide deformylase